LAGETVKSSTGDSGNSVAGGQGSNYDSKKTANLNDSVTNERPHDELERLIEEKLRNFQIKDKPAHVSGLPKFHGDIFLNIFS
jgi:hypothetical protein